MAILSVKLKENKSDNHTKYNNKINPDNFRELSLVLKDLKNLGLPVEKAIKQFRLELSDWDVALGL